MYFKDTFLPCMTSSENEKKSAKISGGELWSSISLVHVWVEYPEASRCQVHLFKRLYSSINSMLMFTRNTIQEGDGFCVPEMNVFWCEMCESTLEKRQKPKILAGAGRKVSSSPVQ
ncbi:hypothetical protein ILYODFUR_013425 [Ilyodon furcidens]|uniref:Uncharacterized protein n=1 Tax=Ilyodon furcidens TaxID=33524 RepID=A0ABV0TI99_9TELE